MKKILGLIAGLAAFLGIMLLALSSAGTELHAKADGTDHTHCICAGAEHATAENGHTCDDSVVWTPVSQSTDITTPIMTSKTSETHYYFYLTQDITLARDIRPYANNYVHICLNGFNLKSKNNGRVFMIYSPASGKEMNESAEFAGQARGLTVCDCQGTGQVVPQGALSETQQGHVMANLVAAATFEMYGITVEGGTSTGNNGGAFHLQGTNNFYDCVLTGGKTTGVNSTSNISGGEIAVSAMTASVNLYNCTVSGGEATVGRGGNIYVSAGNVTLKDTVVSGGTAKLGGGNIALNGTGTFTLLGNTVIENGTTTGLWSDSSAGTGGNIVMINSNAILNIEGNTVIRNGRAGNGTATEPKSRGGNIAMSSGTVNLKSGTLSSPTNDMYATRGVNVMTYGSNAKFNMSGGTITGGKSNEFGTSVYVNGGTFTMTGGVIENGIGTNDGGNIGIASGTATVSDGTIRNGESVLGGNVYVYGGTFTLDGTGVIENGKVTDPTKSAQRGGNIAQAGGTLNIMGGTVQNGTTSNQGYYGGNISQSAGTMNMSGGTVSGGRSTWGGNIYIGKTLNLSGGTITGGVTTGSAGNIAVGSGATVTMTGGTISNGTAPTYGGNIQVYSNDTDAGGKFYMSAGTISGGWAATSTKDSGSARGGGNIHVGNLSVFEMTGGVIENGNVGKNSTGSAYCYGGNIRSTGTVTITGGEVRNGQAGTDSTVTAFSVGGNIFAAGTCTIDGTAKVYGGRAKSGGGNIGVAGTVNITGNAEVYGGNVGQASGGNIFMDTYSAGILNVSGGRIYGGTASKGGNIYCQSTNANPIVMTGGEISGGVATSDTTNYGLGGNIYIKTNKMTMSGGVVKNGTAKKGTASEAKNADGGNFSICASGKVEITGTALVTFDNGIVNAPTGGNIYVESAELTISGGTVSNGKASANGGNIYASSSVLTFSGGTITGGTAGTSNSGGNIWASCAMTVSGCTISNGTAGANGGNIYSVTADFTMTDGVISGGTANKGGNCYLSASNTSTINTVTISGGTITGGTSADLAGNVFLYAKQLYMSRGTIENGTSKKSGGNLYFDNSKGSLTGGTVTGGTVGAGNAGGNLYLNGTVASGVFSTDVVIDGATISNGTATPDSTNNGGHGGNILMATAKLTLLSGTISGGKASGAGGTAIALIGNANATDASRSEFYMYGGTISGGMTNEKCPGAIRGWRDNNVIEIHGGQITGNSMAVYAGSGSLVIDSDDAYLEGTTNAVYLSSSIGSASISAGHFKGAVGGADAANAKKTVSGGYFVDGKLPGAAFLLDHHFAKTVTETYSGTTFAWRIVEGYLANVTSRTDTSAESIATLTGGGYVETNAPFTLSAEDLSDYEFLGWWVGAYDANTAPASTSLNYTVTGGIAADTDYVAVYKQGETLISYKFIGARYTVKIGTADAEEKTGTTEGTAPVGTEITVEYADETIKFWKNASEKIVTRSGDYTFTLYVETELRAETAEESGKTVVIFLSDCNQLVQKVSTNTALTELPATPVRVGKSAGTWSKTLTEINEAIAAGTEYVEVKAQGYENLDITYTISVLPATLTGDTLTVTAQTPVATFTQTGAEPATVELNVNDEHFFVAIGSPERFSVLAYESIFSVRVMSDTTLYLVSLESAAEVLPTIAMTAMTSTAQGDGKFTISIGATRDVPDDYELIEQGILMVVGATVSSDEEADAKLALGTAGVTKLVSTGKDLKGATIVNVKNAPSGTVIYAKGYLVYKATDATEAVTVYSTFAKVVAE